MNIKSLTRSKENIPTHVGQTFHVSRLILNEKVKIISTLSIKKSQSGLRAVYSSILQGLSRKIKPHGNLSTSQTIKQRSVKPYKNIYRPKNKVIYVFPVIANKNNKPSHFCGLKPPVLFSLENSIKRLI